MKKSSIISCFTSEFAIAIDKLYKDEGVQKCLQKSSEIQISDSAE